MRYLQRDSIPQPLRSGQTGLFKTIELRLEYLSVQCNECMFLSCHIHVQSQTALCNCLDVNKLIARNRHDILNLSDWHGTRTQNHLIRKLTFNHIVIQTSQPKIQTTKLASFAKQLNSLAKSFNVGLQTKWLWVRVPLQSLEVYYVMHCAIFFHQYNLENVKNAHGGVLLLVKLQTEASNITKSNTPP